MIRPQLFLGVGGGEKDGRTTPVPIFPPNAPLSYLRNITPTPPIFFLPRHHTVPPPMKPAHSPYFSFLVSLLIMEYYCTRILS